MTAREQAAWRPRPVQPTAGRVLQRACACGTHSGTAGECNDCRGKRLGTLRRAAVNADPGSAGHPAIIDDVVRSPGSPLDHTSRTFMEQRFGHDFSDVRIHVDDQAAASARAVGAAAWTVGKHISFGAGNYEPHARRGRLLLAHELAHVVQQGDVPASLGTTLPIGARGNSYERAANAASHDVVAGRYPVRINGGAPAQVQRQDPIFVDIETPTPKKAEELRQQGIDLPKASAQAADPRNHSDFIDRRINAVGFGIYLGGYHLYVDGLDLPVFLPNGYVSDTITNVTNVDSAIYPSRDEAVAAIPAGPPAPGSPWPITYFRAVGGLVFPAYVSPGSAPQTYKTMIEARRELGRQVSNELTGVALGLMGGFLVKGIIGGVRRVTGKRPAPAPPEPPTPRNAPKPGAAPAPAPGKPGGQDLFYKPKVQADPTLPPGAGATNKYGDVRYSSKGSPSDVALAKHHEAVHSALSPKLKYFREFRADLGMTGYQKSQFLRYLEEALAETYAQLRVKGFSGLPAGIQFPIKNGYVSLTGVVTEAAIGSLVIGGTTYGVYVVVTDTSEGK